MCKGAWLFCCGAARLIFQTTRYVLMQASMPATFLLALRALFDATTLLPASLPFFMFPCSGMLTLGSPFRGVKSAMCSPSPSRSTIFSNPAVLSWHLSRCHLTPAPGLVMPNASGCAAVALSALLADSMPAVPLARAGVVPPFVRINRFNTRARTDFPRIGVGVQSCAPLHLWDQCPINFPCVRIGIQSHAPLRIHVSIQSCAPLRLWDQHLINFSRVRIGIQSRAPLRVRVSIQSRAPLCLWGQHLIDFPCICIGIQSHIPLRLWGQRPINFPRICVGIQSNTPLRLWGQCPIDFPRICVGVHSCIPLHLCMSMPEVSTSLVFTLVCLGTTIYDTVWPVACSTTYTYIHTYLTLSPGSIHCKVESY